MKKILYLFILTCSSIPTKGKVSDFMLLPVPKRLATKEDFIKTDSITMNINEKQDAIARNIYFLELALIMPFDHPIKALIRITTELQYQKYQYAVNAYLNDRLAQEYRRYADLYYKENIYFFNNEYYKEYLNGYDVAEFYLKGALKYRRRAQEEAEKARSIPEELNPNRDQSLIDFDEKIYKLTKNPYDFEEIFKKLLTELDTNRKKVLKLQDQAS